MKMNSDSTKRKNIDWADRQCKTCIAERAKENATKKGKTVFYVSVIIRVCIEKTKK